ncbi:TonB-dependent receptor [Sphingomonas sp. PAMC 26621]|uniref:TonB-dependent receptor n=1 Tax=Sphingomonas sp. PAMC 26621 TaxID=1112213 RepID=UPI00028A05B2|nr:TonB-dependent receptor [Sphingomonas sp. PAMC 26621]
MTEILVVQAKQTALRSFLLASAAAVIVGTTPHAAFAQAAAETPDDTSGDIVVTGYQRSLRDARAIKKNSVIQKDAIVAEDMAKFPELNLAESLQRLPGVQITREAGEGRRISLRGLGSDFARVQLNGMEVLGNVDSAQDSRGQRSRDRSFDFNIFASELFQRVEVEKTYEAAQTEGGMGGTVGLFTPKPLESGVGTKGAITGKIGTNQYTKDAQPRVAGLFSQNWGNTFGIALSAAYSKRRTTEQGRDTYNYNKPSASDLQDMVAGGLDISHLTAAQRTKFLSGDLYFADGNRVSSFDASQERLGLTATVQWRPAPNLLLTLDGLRGQLTTHRDEYHLATRPINGTGSVAFDGAAGKPYPAAFQTASVLNSLAWDANNYVTATDTTGATFGSEHRRQLNKTRFSQAALTFKWDASDRFTVDGHVGYEKSTYDTPYDDKLYLRGKGNLVADYGTDGRSASFTYPNFDPTNAAAYAMDNFYYRAFNNSSELREGVINLRYKLNDAFTLRAGGAYHRFKQDGANYFYDGNVNGTTDITRGTSVAGITSVYNNSFGSWVVGDFDKAFTKYKEYHRLGPKADGTGSALQDIEQVVTTSEETESGYAQLDWHGDLFGMTARGNVGVRGYHTDTQSIGWIQGDNYAYLGTADVKGHYSGVLPAMNAVLELTPQVLLRFAAAQNLNRPGLGSMAAQGSASQDDVNGKITASRGNPNLKPYKDNTLDLAVEYYFGKAGLLSASVYKKWITNFIGSQQSDNITFADAGVPTSVLTGATPSTIIANFSMPINVAGTNTVTGAEIAAQSQFSFLPAPFDHLGAVANFSYVDADEKITGISKTSYNATLYFENKLWGVRGSLNQRSRYYTSRSATVMSSGTQGFEATTYVDAAAYLNVNSALQLTFNAVNLTNQKDTQFWGQNRYLYNQTQSGATYMLGFGFKF